MTLFKEHFKAYWEGEVEKESKDGITISTSLLALFMEQRSCTTTEMACHAFMLRQALCVDVLGLDWGINHIHTSEEQALHDL